MELKHLIGQCVFCGNERKPYDPSPDANPGRFCCMAGASDDIEQRLGSNLELFPTVFPVPADPREREHPYFPPHPREAHGLDLMAVEGTHPDRNTRVEECPSAFPFPFDSRTAHLRCGNPTVYNLGGRATSFGFKEGAITVCDMSTYLWSNTLKDPRSWAVLHNALSSGIRHLGTWTAGNAGYSLAKQAYTINRLLKPSERIRVYCYASEGELAIEVRRKLQLFRANVSLFDLRRRQALTPAVVLKKLNASLQETAEVPTAEYWDVTDGWDGVGLYAYRLLARQLCAHLKPKYIVAPLGTGDLFYGLFQGRQDCVARKKIEATDCILVAAVPHGRNVLLNFEDYGFKVPYHRSVGLKAKPVAPKLETIYSPLLPVLWGALRDPSVRVQEVLEVDQNHAARALIAHGTRDWITAEPSALIAFGALPGLAAHHVHAPASHGKFTEADASVVVINTGCGVISRNEGAFLDSFLGGADT